MTGPCPRLRPGLYCPCHDSMYRLQYRLSSLDSLACVLLCRASHVQSTNSFLILVTLGHAFVLAVCEQSRYFHTWTCLPPAIPCHSHFPSVPGIFSKPHRSSCSFLGFPEVEQDSILHTSINQTSFPHSYSLPPSPLSSLTTSTWMGLCNLRGLILVRQHTHRPIHDRRHLTASVAANNFTQTPKGLGSEPVCAVFECYTLASLLRQ